MRYLNPLRYIHYHTQLAIPTIYDDSLSFYEVMNKTNLHFNEVINDMNENYEIIDKAFQEVLEQTNKWMEEAKAQADRAEQEANKSQASAEDAKNQADRASSEADAAAASALEAQNQADRASSEADRAHTEAENAKAQAQAAANSAQESATSAAASAGSASESAASATESKKSADASAASATESKNSADASANSASQSAASATASQNSAVASANSASQSAASATASQNSAVASANSASQAAQSATDAANSAKEAADTLDEAKETFVKKAGDTMSGKLTISYGGLSVDGSAGISGDLNTGRLQVGKPEVRRDTHLYGNLYLKGMLNMSIGSNVALKFANLQEGLKLYAPLSFEPSPLRISNVGNPQNDFDAVNKITLDSKVTGINAELTDVNNQIAALTTRMGTAEKNITKNTSDIASLTNRVTTNETSINNINTEITNIKQDITTVEGDYVKKAGDTMTSNLTMGLNQIVMDTGHIVAGNNTLLFEGYPLIDVDGAKISMVADPVEAMDAANKEYVDNAVAGGGGESYYDSEHKLIFLINPISTDLNVYECKCYLLEGHNYTINFPANMSAGEVSIIHNLNSYLTTNNYKMSYAKPYFINVGVTNAGYSFCAYANLFDSKIRAKATLSYKTDTATSVNLTVSAGFLCSAILTKTI